MVRVLAPLVDSVCASRCCFLMVVIHDLSREEVRRVHLRVQSCRTGEYISSMRYDLTYQYVGLI
jgi:hypothetical protein